MFVQYLSSFLQRSMLPYQSLLSCQRNALETFHINPSIPSAHQSVILISNRHTATNEKQLLRWTNFRLFFLRPAGPGSFAQTHGYTLSDILDNVKTLAHDF